MTSSDVPNKDRAEGTLSIYRSEMRRYISLSLEREYGPDWVLSMLSNDTRERYPGLQGDPGVTPEELVDVAEFPHLIQDNRHSFDDLRRADIDRMHWIRVLHNELYHADHVGDCTSSYADAVVGLCGLVLERCGLLDAVERIRQLSLGEAAVTAQRDRVRFRERHVQALAETEGLRGALDAARADRALLIYRAAMRQHIQSILQREYGSDWLSQVLGGEGRVRARRLRMLDQGHDPEEMLDVGDFPFVTRANRQFLPHLRPADIDAMHSIRDLRNAIVHDAGPTPDRADTIVDLCSQVLERCGLVSEAETVRRLSLPAFNDDEGLRRWFDADEGRRQRHRSEHAALEQREQDRREQDRWERERDRRAGASPLSSAADSKSRTGAALPDRTRSFLSRIFRR